MRTGVKEVWGFPSLGKHASVGAHRACSMLYSPPSATTAALWLKMSASGTMDMPAFHICMISSQHAGYMCADVAYLRTRSAAECHC